MRENIIRIQIQALYLNGIDQYACPAFLSVRNEAMKDAARPALLCGAGTVLESAGGLDASVILPGKRAAFVAFGAPAFSEVLAIPANCVIPLPDGLSFTQAAAAGTLVPLAAAAERAHAALGEHIAVLCRAETAETVKRFFETIGCVPHIASQGTWGGEGFAEALLSATAGRGADAVILLGVEPPETLPLAALCKDTSRIVCAQGIGAGYDDADYMQGRTRYPHGYTRKTPQDNLRNVIGMLKGDACRIHFAIAPADDRDHDGEEIVLLKDPVEQTVPVISPACSEQFNVKWPGIDALKKKCATRLSPCLLQMTARYAVIPENAEKQLLAAACYVLGEASVRVDELSGTNTRALNVLAADGSAASLHAISGYTHDTLRCELHFDGCTVVLDENGVKAF